ncbi:DEAD/DEAH box helicase [Singulisphaera sp. Ch08]|uniref:DEAD/DEAH box helicase n=1 Tax=Singulisphaera sp. Ch08 TaxID=3120278 RepID=A0AAU7CGP5_9BACT
MHTQDQDSSDGHATLTGPVRAWFTHTFPGGPTPAQALAWPPIAAGEHLLLISPTGTGKTLAAFLAIVDQLFRELASGTLSDGLRCVYVSPLRSLGYDIERNLAEPLQAIQRSLGLAKCPVEIGVRTGDTSAYQRRKLRDKPPHLLITTPESLSLLLSQEAWHDHWRGVRHLIVDEVHALVPTKRGVDLAVSLERVAAKAAADPCRIGLSATCRPAEPVARFLVGPSRPCRIIEAPLPEDAPPMILEVESLLKPDEAPHRGLTYRRLLRRLERAVGGNRTTVVFANTRALTEKITHDLRRTIQGGTEAVAAHHSALDADRRRQVEAALKAGELRAVVTSTSLELGVDIGSADLTVQVGLPGGVSRCLQRVGRSGHRLGVASRGLLLAATPAELAGGVVTAEEARLGRVEPLRSIAAPLDVVCQQLIGMACGEEWATDVAFDLIRKAGPMAELARADFDLCLDFLAGELAAPAGATESETGPSPRWTAPRLWRRRGLFGLRSRRVARWFRSNVGTITSEESVRVLEGGVEVGTLEGAYAERLQVGDKFILDGRSLEFRRLEGLIVHAKAAGGEPSLPRWSSDRQSLSAELALALVEFREQAAAMLADGPSALRGWLGEAHGLDPRAAGLLVALFEAQEQLSEIPPPGTLLVEESPRDDGLTYTFHAPLNRSACEALGRATAARLGRRFGRDVSLIAADLGWAIRLPDEARLLASEITTLLTSDGFAEDVMEGLDRGELPARRFRHVAATALMVLRNPEGGRRRVGGLLWVSNRLYPMVKALCPDHPLLRETRREILEDLLDVPRALAWLAERPEVRFRSLAGLSPFAAAWVDPSEPEPLHFESPAEALRRLHARLSEEIGGRHPV